MTTFIKPFKALHPSAATAGDVIAPPYDVMDTEEARALAEHHPHSFLHISRPEIDFAPGTDPHSETVYARAAENLKNLCDSGVLLRDTRPCFYVYRMTTDSHQQTGVALSASVEAYEHNRVRKHELTKPDKETDRARNIATLNAQTGPTLCAFRASDTVSSLLRKHAETSPLFEVEGPSAVVHSVWRVEQADAVAELTSALNALDVLYIADGHHRSAAAARVARARRGGAENPQPDSSYEYFLCVAFPHDELEILDYNRVVSDLNGLTAAEFLESIEQSFNVESCSVASKPNEPATYTMYVEHQWYRLTLEAEIPDDPVRGLDISLLQKHLIEPVLGIYDPRTDPRIDFVGGVRGLTELQRRVDTGQAAAAFALHPTTMEQLMAVADAEQLMPPKSTWFEPKLADGLVSHIID